MGSTGRLVAVCAPVVVMVLACRFKLCGLKPAAVWPPVVTCRRLWLPAWLAAERKIRVERF